MHTHTKIIHWNLSSCKEEVTSSHPGNIFSDSQMGILIRWLVYKGHLISQVIRKAFLITNAAQEFVSWQILTTTILSLIILGDELVLSIKWLFPCPGPRNGLCLYLPLTLLIFPPPAISLPWKEDLIGLSLIKKEEDDRVNDWSQIEQHWLMYDSCWAIVRLFRWSACFCKPRETTLVQFSCKVMVELKNTTVIAKSCNIGKKLRTCRYIIKKIR